MPRSREKTDPYPNRALAAEIARRLEMARTAIESVLAEKLRLAADPPALWWFERMLARHDAQPRRRG